MDHETEQHGGDTGGGRSRPAAEPGALGPRSLRSWTILAASLALALAVYYGFLGSSWVEFVAAWTADWTSRGLNLMGGSTYVSGTLLVSDNFVANIVAECTAVGPLVLFIGAVVAYPAPSRAKAVGAAVGFVVLTLVNVVRIMSLFWIGSSYPEYLDVAHLLVWQSAIILLAIVMWLLWAERVGRARQA